MLAGPCVGVVVGIVGVAVGLDAGDGLGVGVNVMRLLVPASWPGERFATMLPVNSSSVAPRATGFVPVAAPAPPPTAAVRTNPAASRWMSGRGRAPRPSHGSRNAAADLRRRRPARRASKLLRNRAAAAAPGPGGSSWRTALARRASDRSSWWLGPRIACPSMASSSRSGERFMSDGCRLTRWWSGVALGRGPLIGQANHQYEDYGEACRQIDPEQPDFG